LRQWKPNFLVVDECHCLWEWGEGFRPAFRRIPDLIHSLNIPSTLWLTATLPVEAREELRRQLPAPLHELGGFDLPPLLRLSLARVRWADRAEALAGWVRNQRGAGIVFAPTRESAERLARLLRAARVSTITYHAGMSSEERRAAEGLVKSQAAQAIIATSAFGMGMNYPHLEWVALWQAPVSLLAFAQAIGRVGRGAACGAQALALWDADDFRLLEWSIRDSSRRRRQLEWVSAFYRSRNCRRADLRAYFEQGNLDGLAQTQPSSPSCDLCDVCHSRHETRP
jgi:superfamily II DNA helicase RecQ